MVLGAVSYERGTPVIQVLANGEPSFPGMIAEDMKTDARLDILVLRQVTSPRTPPHSTGYEPNDVLTSVGALVSTLVGLC